MTSVNPSFTMVLVDTSEEAVWFCLPCGQVGAEGTAGKFIMVLYLHPKSGGQGTLSQINAKGANVSDIDTSPGV